MNNSLRVLHNFVITARTIKSLSNPPSAGTSPGSPHVVHSISPKLVPCPGMDSEIIHQHISTLPGKHPHLKLHLRELVHNVRGGVLDFSKRDIPIAKSLDRRLVECDKVPQHRARFVERAVAVIFGNTILLQEIVFEHPGNLQRDLVSLSQRALADKLHDFCEIFLLLQNLLGTRPDLDKARF